MEVLSSKQYHYDVDSNDNLDTLPGQGHATVTYFNHSTNTHFAVVLGSFLGHPWALITFVPHLISTLKHCRCGPLVQALYSIMHRKSGSEYRLVKHLHLPDGLSGVRSTYQHLPQPSSHLVTLDIIRCRFLSSSHKLG